MLIIITILIFVSIGGVVAAATYQTLNQKLVKERLAQFTRQESPHESLIPAMGKAQSFLARMGNKIRMKASDLQIYRSMVTAAGFRSESLYIFLGAKLVLAGALPGGFIFFYALPHGRLDQLTLLAATALAISGYLAPTFLLSHLAQKRKTEIFHSLPDVLDLLTVCVEAGLSLDSAFLKTVEHYQQKNNPLISEINTTTLEIRAGRPRQEALRGFADRTGVEDIKAFVAMMGQTEKFGTSIGKTLRTYSDSLRIRRKQLAEERAAKTGVKMLFPLIFCIFPALLVVMLAPALVRIYAIFTK